MAENITGLILQGISGFYLVEAADTVMECRARGLFRKEGITPLAGDQVTVYCDGDSATIMEILPRRNSLIRPPVANVDVLALVVSLAAPAPNLLILDRMIAVAEHKEIEPVIILNKTDLADPVPLETLYRQAGFPVYSVCAKTGSGVDLLQSCLSGKVVVFTGNSGAGKSSLLNRMAPELNLATGDISRKLGRGRHTTRSATLYHMPCGGYWADTPGFSSLDTTRAEPIRKEELAECFRDFTPYIGRCRYASCTHTKEEGCAVREAVAEGKIAASRHENYAVMYEEAKQIREWERG